MSDIVISGLLETWKNNMINEFGGSRFDSKNREEMLSALIQMLQENDFSIEEAGSSTVRNKIKEVLVVKDKGRHKFKGWIISVENHYNRLLFEAYGETIKSERRVESESTVNRGSSKIIAPNDPWIPIWLSEKFSIVNERMIEEAHEVGSQLNLQYQEEVIFNPNCDFSRFS